MIRALYCAADGTACQALDMSQVPNRLRDETGVLWVDFMGEPPSVDEPILREVFGFHPLAVDDALRETHVPKLDDWGQYLYLVLHSLIYDDNNGNEPIGTVELDIFLGPNYLVTHHDRPVAALDRAWDLVQRDERHARAGTERVLYLLVDELVGSYMPVLEALEDTIDAIEDVIFGDPGPKMVERIFTLKRSLLRLRRIIAPEREVLNKLARDNYAVVRPASRVFFRDVYDHLVRMYDITESLRDLVSGALDTYLSVINNRMNEVMKTLTVITTLFMPLSFLTGFFGMNFFQPVASLPAWTNVPAFLIALSIMALTPIGMFLWMRRRAWM